jgi:hypothetical protein
MVKSGVKDAYQALKAVIIRKWGSDAAVSKAITAIEQDPQSKAQAAVLEEKVASVKALEDADVLQALHHLIEQMKLHGVGGEAVAAFQVTVNGGSIVGVAGAQNVQVGSMSFGSIPKV